jgi:hypothetical protein
VSFTCQKNPADGEIATKTISRMRRSHKTPTPIPPITNAQTPTLPPARPAAQTARFSQLPLEIAVAARRTARRSAARRTSPSVAADRIEAAASSSA